MHIVLAYRPTRVRLGTWIPKQLDRPGRPEQQHSARHPLSDTAKASQARPSLLLHGFIVAIIRSVFVLQPGHH